MAYSAIAVANAFIEKAKKLGISDISPMKIQKLVYFAHAWMLAAEDRPLIDEPVMAWKFGPVIQSIYHEFKGYGSGNITSPGTIFEHDENANSIIKMRFVAPEIPDSDKDALSIVDAILDVYGDKSAFFLSNLTHEHGSAWQVTSELHHNGCEKGYVIPNEVIKRTTKNELGLV
ncbi:Panacea domain-containing protein [Serratia plymuthica]|nr:type II toxin-antitoxin system antitoxin SocA domain-containing protein [Serratia plymuthica]